MFSIKHLKMTPDAASAVASLLFLVTMSARFSRRLAGCALLSLAAISAACSGQDPEVARSEHTRRGDDYVKAGKYPEAIIEYRSAIQIDPQFGEAHYKLAETYMAAKEGSLALAAYMRAADVPSAPLEAQLKAGQVLLLARQYGDARSRALAILEKEPGHPQALLLLGNALAGLKSVDEAVAANRRALALDPDRAGMYVNLGALEYIKGDVKASEAAYRAAIDADPASVMAVVALADFLAITGRPAEAEAAYHEALKMEPTHAAANRALAMFYLESGRLRQAEVYLRKIAEITSSTSSLLDLADFYIASGQRKQASEMLEVMASKPAAFTEASLKLALIASIEGRSSDAIAIIDRVLARDRSNATALALKAQVYLRDGRTSQALETSQAAVRINPKVVAAQYAYGKAAKSRGETAIAKNAFLEVLKLRPGAIEALLELTDLHLQAGLTDSALQYAQEALRINPRLVEGRIMLARALARNPDNAGRAATEIAKLEKEYPKSPSVQLELGRIALERGDVTRANQAFVRVLQADPNSLDATIELVKIDLAAERFAAARARVDAALLKQPDSPTLLVFAGKAYMGFDQAASEKHLLRAVEIDPSSIDAYQALVILYISQKRLDPAREQFEKLALQQPKSPSPATMVGVLYEAQGRTDLAEKWYEKALNVSPRATTAANNLAWLYADQGKNLDVAMQLARNAYDDLRTQPEVIDTLGWVHLKKGMPETAAKHFQEALDLAPNNPVYLYHLGLAYSQTGDHAKARTALQSALKSGPTFRYAAQAKVALAKLLY